jgi:hypothetical protein
MTQLDLVIRHTKAVEERGVPHPLVCGSRECTASHQDSSCLSTAKDCVCATMVRLPASRAFVSRACRAGPAREQQKR